MPSVNKKSMREELDSLKSLFNEQLANGKMSSENQALFRALLGLIEIMFAVFMEKTTRKTKDNSSIPSSQTEKDETTPPKKGANGKGPGQNDEVSSNTRTVEVIEILPVNDCEYCGEDLSQTPCETRERRTLIDIIFTRHEDHKDAEVKVCPKCKKQTKATFPSSHQGPLQYGPGIKAYMLNLLIAQMVALGRIQKMVKTLIGVVISEATILKYVLQLHHALEEWENSAIEQLMAMPTLHVDETSMRINKKNHWVHVCSGGDITLKWVHPKRGKEAIEDIDIIPRYGGVIIHDCWKSYLTYNNCRHGLCGSHLLRELTFIVDSNGYRWAANMKALLQEMCHEVSQREEKRLTEEEYLNLQMRYRNILTQGEKELPPIPERQKGKRGRLAKSDAHNLWERLKEYEHAVLLFAREPHVSFTNNRAERDLRMGKVKQKVSGCFRVELYAKAYCRISSYLQTMNAKGYNPLVAIQMALAGKVA